MDTQKWFAIAFTTQQHSPLIFYSDSSTATSIMNAIVGRAGLPIAVWTWNGTAWQPIYGF